MILYRALLLPLLLPSVVIPQLVDEQAQGGQENQTHGSPSKVLKRLSKQPSLPLGCLDACMYALSRGAGAYVPLYVESA